MPNTAAPSHVAAAMHTLTRKPALTTVGLTLAVVFGVALGSAILLMTSLELLGQHDVPTPFGVFVVAMGFSLGGGLQATISPQLLGSDAYVSANVGLTVLPLGTLLAIAVGVYLLARRRAPVDESAAPLGAMTLRAAVEAAVAALLACLLTALGSYDPAGTGEAVVRASAASSLLMTWVIVFAALILARAGVQLTSRVPARLRQVLRELGALATIIGVVLGVVSIVVAVFAAFKNDAGGAIPLLPVLVGNLIVYALTLGTLGGIAGSFSAPFLQEFGVSDVPYPSGSASAWDIMGAWSILLYVAVLVVAVAGAARVGVRRPRLAAADPARTWQMPVAVLAAGLIVLHLLAPVRLSGRLLGQQATASVGPAWWSSLTLALFALIVSVLAEVLPAWLYANANSFLRLCAGTQAVEYWATGQAQPAQQQSFVASTAVPPAPAFTPAPAPAPDEYVAPYAAQPNVTSTPTPAPAAPPPPAVYVPSAPVASATSAPAAMSANAAGAPVPPLPAPQPMDPAARRRLKRVAGAVVACLVLVGAGAIAVHVLNARRGPEQAVEAYLELLADGHAAEATAMVDPGVPNDQRLLLTDETLGAATSRIEVVDVEAPSDTDTYASTGTRDSVTVTATISLDGERFDVPIVVKAGDKEYGVLNTWEVDTPLVREVTLSSYTLGAVTVGGTQVPLETSEYDGGSATQYVYFGIYDVGVDADVSDYLTADTTELNINSTSSTTVQVEGEATEALENLVLDAVNAQATECVTPPGNMDEVCPYALQSTELDSLEVTAEATEVTVNGTAFKSGSITFTTRNIPTSWNKNPKDKDWNYTFSGTIEWPEDGDDEPIVTVTDSYVYYGY
ncbi:hypothetical protein [Actinomyces sp. Z5]|uniref:hypothetical protein n=1 Tax=Actinomyces sp. Z5 TaxID=2250216 RepID=UPI0011BD5843|nr:hypothetical protein [Actinomyces sp. Z5]